MFSRDEWEWEFILFGEWTQVCYFRYFYSILKKMASLFVFEFWRALLPAKSKLRNNKQTSLKKRIFELLKNTRLLKG